MKGKIYGYNMAIACEVDTNAASILHFIYWWCDHNRYNRKHFIDGHYWTYNSVSAFTEQFPNMSERQIRYALKKLEDQGYIIISNYNDNKFDKTSWYAVTDKTLSYYEDDISDQFDVTNLSDGDNTNVTRTNNIYIKDKDNTVNNQLNNTIVDSDKSTSESKPKKNDKKEAQEMFLRCWKLYPKKEGKGQVSDSKKLKLYHDVGEEQLCRCIDRYKRAKRNTGRQYIMNGSTFFNSGYEDYLDENIADTRDTSSLVGNSQKYKPTVW